MYIHNTKNTKLCESTCPLLLQYLLDMFSCSSEEGAAHLKCILLTLQLLTTIFAITCEYIFYILYILVEHQQWFRVIAERVASLM